MLFFGNRKKELEAEIARLEAFLSAMPGAYCGWSAKGDIAYAPEFPKLLKLDEIKDIYDIYNALTPTDAAAMEGHFTALRRKGTDFSYEAKTSDEKRIIRFSGKRGRNLALDVSYDILCGEDITDIALEKSDLTIARDVAERDDHLKKMILDTLPIPVWFCDNKGRLTWVNRYYAESIESTRERAIDKQFFIMLGSAKKGHQDTPIRTLDILAKDAASVKEAQIQENHAVLGGKRKLLRIVVIPTEDGGGSVGMAKDITKQEDVETRYHQLVGNTQLLLEQMQAAIVSFDGNQVVDFYNTQFAQLWDLEDSWLDKKPKLGEIMERLREMRRLPEQADFRSFKNSWQDMFTDLFDTKEDLMHLPDNTTLRVLFVPRPTSGLIIIFEDVSSSLEMESRYNTLMAVQRETLDNLAEAVTVFGGDGRLKLYNPNYASMWGINPEDLNGEPHITKLVEKKKSKFAEEEWEESRQLLMRHALDRVDHDDYITLKDGSTIQVYTVPLPDGGVMISYDDITATVQVENALREKNSALEEAERLKLDFLANVSYQLRTPLNAIMGFAEILSNQYFGELNERQGEYTRGITEAGNRLLSLIDDILDISTIEAGYLELRPDTIDVKAMAEHIYNLTNEWARKENVRLALNCAKNIGQITADERRLKQVMLNLIRNAITYTKEDGKVEITVKRKKDGHVMIAVSDNGEGMSEEDQKKVFEPFEQGSKGKMNKGVGLGLSLVRDIVKLHGGEVSLESAVGKGTTVTLLIPNEVKENALEEYIKEKIA